MAEPAHSNFKLHVGIDFGTDGSGLAYALPNGDVFIHNKWKSKKYGAITKPKTQILLNEEGNCVAFGIDASDVYSSLDKETQKKWLLFERFKMALYQDLDGALASNPTDEEDLKQDALPDNHDSDNDASSSKNEHSKKASKARKITIKKELTAMNGTKYPSELVFVEALKYLKSEATKYCRKLKVGKPKDNEIQWILTVPAIWNDYAKNQMREWAIKAALVDPDVADQLKIVFEPDCASLAIQHKIAKAKKKSAAAAVADVDNEDSSNNINGNNGNHSSKSLGGDSDFGKTVEESHFAEYTFGKGQKYILIDAGGGTVDIAFHEILGDFGVKECHHPSGGPWGSTYIDEEFMNVMDEIFTAKWMDEFKQEEPNKYTEMLMNFRASKNQFDPINNQNGEYHNIRLPLNFLSFLEERIPADAGDGDDDDASDFDIEEAMASMVENCTIHGQQGWAKFSDELLSLHVDLWRAMFEVSITPIIEHCHELCRDKTLLKHTKYVCLVGGLSSSSYFEKRVTDEFGPNSKYKFIMIKPERPMLTVVEGAALFGITENYIQARVLSKTYGVEGALFLDEAKSIKIPDSHIEAHKLYHPHHAKWRVTGIFCPIASKHDTIYTNQVIQRTTTRAHQNDSYVSVTIWCSNEKHPILTPTCQHLASMIIKFDGSDAKDSDLEIEFHFYDTLLRVFAYPKTQPHHKKEVELQYATN
eukprot:CAMPEP_0202686228 /NCGR_PEP_ID=MMETSP1385-20130828/2038_1 /ASSEMBLY_ACC=CAM_ASM_000861 /TAXON_ID=933848 /ORGANISM="Elphidium margaritaceum" /LENGTH=702 /DNA_ID=CAMNT_0049340761 /DNA_START=32 /DNA_END=2140 /DNA_ORIENTATION=-